jgi:hypothetical protein
MEEKLSNVFACLTEEKENTKHLIKLKDMQENTIGMETMSNTVH